MFTSSQKAYADKILDYIDYEKKLIHHRLYRENCVRYSGNIYIKDLRVLRRDLKSVVIVDNAPYAFAPQLENGYPIIPFYDNQGDDEIIALTTYLKNIQNVEDVREENRKKFKLTELSQFEIGKYLQYYMPGNSDISSGDVINDSPPVTEGGPKVSSTVKASLNMFKTAMDNCYKKESN